METTNPKGSSKPTDNGRQRDGLFTRNGANFMIPFFCITACFALWGFANDVTSPMVKAFSKIFRMSVTEGALVQVAFYLGYFVMAFPAAMFIRKYSFKAGVTVGLALYAVGALMFFPAKAIGMYIPFLLAYFIMTCGLSFLETSCNPYIYCMGSEETATRRLNMAQAFNPLGALAGMYVAMVFVQARMNPMPSDERMQLPEVEFNLLKEQDLSVLIQPYLFIGIVVLLLLIAISVMKMPKDADTPTTKNLRTSLAELARVRNYREGVIAQFFYVGAQVMCWTFIIQYGTAILMGEGMEEHAAEILSQKFNIAALVLFTLSRFICTWFLQYISAGKLLTILAVAAIVAVCGVIMFTDRRGLYCLVAVSGCMSLMFPTIYGIALYGVGENVKVGGAGLIMSILGGSVFPPLQAALIDKDFTVAGLPATNTSFVMPLICFLAVAIYGLRTHMREQKRKAKVRQQNV